MKTNILKGILLASGLATASVFAAPLKRADAPADPAWIAHVDCDALRPTTIGQYILTETEKPEAQNKLIAFQAMCGVDLRKQLHGVTLYSAGTASEDGVLVLYADFDADRLSALAKGAKDYQSTEHNKHTISNWIDEQKRAKDGVRPRTYASIAGNRVIFGQREACVAAALDVIDGTTPSLATSKALPQLGAGDSGNFIQAAARKMDFPNSDPNAAILKMSKLARLQVGETNQQLSATLSLEAKDEEVATQIAQIAQGLLALAKMQSDKPEFVKLGNALALKQDAANVALTLALPANDVIEFFKADVARKKAQHQEKIQAESDSK